MTLPAKAETSDTVGGASPVGGGRQEGSADAVDVPPVPRELRPSASGNPVTWEQLGRDWKVIAAIAGFVIVVVIPFVVWLTSSLTRVDTSLGTVQTDVKDLKTKTETLLVESGKQTVKIDELERQARTQSQMFGERQPQKQAK